MKNKYPFLLMLFSAIIGFTSIAHTKEAEDLIDAEILKKHFTDETQFTAWYKNLNQDDKNQVLAGAVVLCQPSFTRIALDNGANMHTRVFVADPNVSMKGFNTVIYTMGSVDEIEKDTYKRTPSSMGGDFGMMPFYDYQTEGKVYLLTGVIENCRGEPRKQLVRLLLERGADVNDINNDRENAFVTAQRHLRMAEDSYKEFDIPEIFDLLLQHLPQEGLNPEISDTLLIDAYKYQNSNLLKFYQKKNLPINVKTQTAKELFVKTPLPVETEDKESDTTEFLASLLDLGMDVNTQNNLGETALFNAMGDKFGRISTKMNEKAAILLLSKGANPNITDKDGRTPLFRAVRNQDLEAVKLLLNNNADATIIDKEGKSVFSAVYPTNSTALNPEIFKLLIEHGADVKLLNQDYAAALQIADKFGSGEILEILLANGLDANLHDKAGHTLLMNAVCTEPSHYTQDDEYEDISMVTALLENGADVNAQIDRTAELGAGETALFRAARCQHKKIIELLNQFGADTSIKNTQGETAEMIYEQFKTLTKEKSNADTDLDLDLDF